ncbi:AAA family ATPase [bacterium]|nr:AAA family ATPase [bacterium]
MANRYKDFSEFLKKANLDGKQTFTLTVDEIKKNNGGYLPASAEQFQAFWSNYKRYWLEAGYETRNVLRPDDKGNLTVTFYKVSDLKNLEEAEKPDDDIKFEIEPSVAGRHDAKRTGTYLNPGNENFKAALAEEIFVDKSLVLKKFCAVMNTMASKFICVSRPRRFGKSIVGKIMAAYFSKGCDSRELFKDLKIAKEECFEKNLNKFNVISIDLGAAFSGARNKNEIISELENRLREDFAAIFYDIKFEETDSVARMIQRVYSLTGEQFVIIIDEYDVLIREKVDDELLRTYLEFLNSLFKNNELSPAIALAYLTGIMPVIRDKVQSKLNNFMESTMLQPFGFEEYFGFTKEEVKSLCERYGMNFEECEKWYDGYKIGGIDIYNPNSVVLAMLAREYANYWHISGSYEAVSDYIKLDFDGVKSSVIDMLDGKQVPVNVVNFSNSLKEIKNRDNVFTYLIHIGYLNYDKSTGLCRIPNKEIRQEWESAITDSENFSKIVEMIANSDRLLHYTQKGDADKVAAALDEAHTAVSSAKDYNNEACMQSAIMLAYFTAKSKYTVIREMPSGYGFADVGFIPINPKDPAMIIELKYDKDEESAIEQIKNKKYPAAFENYLDNLLLIGVNYDKETKVHECVIEKYQR